VNIACTEAERGLFSNRKADQLDAKTLAAVAAALAISVSSAPTHAVTPSGVLPDGLAKIVDQVVPQIDLVERDLMLLSPKIQACRQQSPLDAKSAYACVMAGMSEEQAVTLGTHVSDVMLPIVLWFPEMRRDFVAQELGRAISQCAADRTPLRFCIRTTLAVVNVMLQ
jgi:hypothetical protein